MDILAIMVVLHLALYCPYFIPEYETRHGQVDTVSKSDGIPYYYMGKFVKMMENSYEQRDY